MLFIRRIAALAALLLLSDAVAEPLTLAVASNFAMPAQELAARFEEASGNPVRITTASTGKLYAQIENGAPFDVLLAADKQRPQLLEDSGLGVRGSRFTYAVGALVLWSHDPALIDEDCKSQLETLENRRLAIANPQTAPYGDAAIQFLQAAELLKAVQSHLVYGENIAQTLHFVVSGNASLGLIARSQAVDPRLPDATCSWPVPVSMHRMLEQQAVQLLHAAENEVAADFLGFLRGPVARQIISEYGYVVPQ
jgi:molybdate transport system substrate-binding protein